MSYLGDSPQVARPPLSLKDAVESDFQRGGAAGPDETEGGLADLPAKLVRYGTARHRATQIMAHLDTRRNKAGPVNRAGRASDRLKHCGEYLGFRHYWTVDQLRLHSASFCRQHLLCPLCAIRRSAKQVKAYVEKVEAVTCDAPALRPVMITYTVKNGPDLKERLKHLRNALQTLTERRRTARKGNRGATTWRHIAGCVGAIEATHSEETGWHPHCHIVALCDGWMDQAQMVEEWRSITGDSFIVGITALDAEKPIVDAFLETFKYALKFSDMSASRVWEAHEVMSGQRMVFSLGNLRGVVVPESLTDEPLEGLPFVEYFYRYLGLGRYGLAGITQSPPDT